MPRFRLLRGAHVQANPDGLDRLNLGEIKKRATAKGIEFDGPEVGGISLRERLIERLRRESPVPAGALLQPDGSLRWEAQIDRNGNIKMPVFESNDPTEIVMLTQDPMKFQSLDGELDRLGYGPITAEEIARRGMAPGAASPQEVAVAAPLPDLEKMTVTELRKFAEGEELNTEGDSGRPLSKAELIAVIRSTRS